MSCRDLERTCDCTCSEPFIIDRPEDFISPFADRITIEGCLLTLGKCYLDIPNHTSRTVGADRFPE